MTIGRDGLNEAQRTCLRLYGITKEQAHAQGICIKCKDPAEPKCRTIPGQREYQISGLCEECFDAAFLQHEDSGQPLTPKALEVRIDFNKAEGLPAEPARPTCFGSNPSPQVKAENVCMSCPHVLPCASASLPAEALIESTLELVNDLFRASARPTADQILAEMADTFRERNKVYGDNYKRVGAVMAAMFPDGIQLKEEDEFNRWHLFELIIVKLTRFANSGLTHKDSIHDAAVYSAMVESLTIDNAFPIQVVAPPKG